MFFFLHAVAADCCGITSEYISQVLIVVSQALSSFLRSSQYTFCIPKRGPGSRLQTSSRRVALFKKSVQIMEDSDNGGLDNRCLHGNRLSDPSVRIDPVPLARP